MTILQKLERALLTGELDESLDQYPEMNIDYLSVQLPLSQQIQHWRSSIGPQEASSGGAGVV